MAENLRFKSPNSFCYNNADSNCTKYGRLYLWTAALDSVHLYENDDEDCGYCKPCPPKYPLRGVCPKGWHLPTETEWETLFETVKPGTTSGLALKSETGPLKEFVEVQEMAMIILDFLHFLRDIGIKMVARVLVSLQCSGALRAITKVLRII